MVTYKPGLRVRSRDRTNSTRRARPRLGTIIGRIGEIIAVQWDGETRAIPYANWAYGYRETGPLAFYSGEPRTWRVVSPRDFEII